MKLKKKVTISLLAAALIFALTGCGTKSPAKENDTTQTTETTETAESAETAETTGAAATGSADTIKIATKPMTEQYILGEMLGMIIENSTDYKVEITKGIGGGTNNIQPAMEKGEFDLYPEYTSSGWVMVLKHEAGDTDDTTMFDQLKSEYESNFDMTWIGLYGFNNTYTVAVRGDIAQQYNLKTTSDLSAVAGELNFGGNPDYMEREDGFNALCDTYNLTFKNVSDVDIGLKYQALRSGDIDVTNAFTTDAQLGNPEADIVTLEDDKQLQVNYFCSTVVRKESLEKFPGLEDALMKMDGLITNEEMAHLNYLVEVEGQDEKDAAADFLLEKGILEAD